MVRALGFLYGVVSYVVFLVAFLYAVGFVGGMGVPRTVDAGGAESSLGAAILINALLLGLFAVQHSVMARPQFKAVWTRVVPRSIERSTFVLLSSLILLLLYWQWRPMPEAVWTVESATGRLVLEILFWVGWGLVLMSTFLISHFDLFGLRQVWLLVRQRDYEPLPFVIHSLYKIIRHPIMLGFLIAFWATPDMTQGHLLFAVATTGYILIGIKLEERDLVSAHGEEYEQYRRQVSMLVPKPPREAATESPSPADG